MGSAWGLTNAWPEVSALKGLTVQLAANLLPLVTIPFPNNATV